MATKNRIKINTNSGETEYEVGTFANKHGKIWFRADMLPSCCGVTVLYDFAFKFNYPNRVYHEKTVHSLFKTFHTWLIYTKRFNINRAKLLISATVNSDLDKFCIYNKWKGDRAQYNAKSGNSVVVYIFNRGVKGDRY